MPCNTCNEPVQGLASLPAATSPYISAGTCPPASSGSHPVVDQKQACATIQGYTCGCATGPTCAPSFSIAKIVQKFVPGWVHKLTAAAKGRLVIANNSALHYFQGDHAGPVHFDGENITVEYPEQITHKGGETAFVENGYLPLARRDEEIRLDTAGKPYKEEVYRHGVQQIREVTVGEQLVLTRDCINGTVRQDVLAPTPHDLVKKGWIAGLKRWAYRDVEIQNNGCATQIGKEWFEVSGAVFGASEVPVDKTANGIEPSLIPVNAGNETAFVLGRRYPTERTSLTAEESNNLRLMVARVTLDPECPDKIAGYAKELMVIPEALLALLNPDDTSTVPQWVPLASPVIVDPIITAATGTIDVEAEISPVAIPAGAYAVTIQAECVSGSTSVGTGLYAYATGESLSKAHVRAISGTVANVPAQVNGPVPLDEDNTFGYELVGTGSPIGTFVITGFYVKPAADE